MHADHVTIYRWVQRFTPEFVEAARPRRHVPGDRWFGDETYVKASGLWSYLYRSADQHGQVIDVYLRCDATMPGAHVLHRHPGCHDDPAEVIIDRAPALTNVIEDLVPAALHNTGQYQNNRVACDHGPGRPAQADGRADDPSHGERGDPGSRLHPEPAPRHYELAVDTTRVFRLAQHSTNSDP